MKLHHLIIIIILLSVSSFAQNISIKCYPDTLYLGDTLTLKFSMPHGGELAVTTPQKDFYFLVQKGEIESQSRSIIPSEEFIKQKEIKIITNSTKAWLYEYGSNENQIIFTKTGKYVFSMSDNLDTDDGTPIYECKVYYINRKKKVNAP